MPLTKHGKHNGEAFRVEERTLACPPKLFRRRRGVPKDLESCSSGREVYCSCKEEGVAYRKRDF